jgi:hypothetical protein
MATNPGANVLTNTVSTYLNGLGINNPAAGYTPTQLKEISQTQKDWAETFQQAFDIIDWFKENWQLAIIGFVALLVLLRD